MRWSASSERGQSARPDAPVFLRTAAKSSCSSKSACADRSTYAEVDVQRTRSIQATDVSSPALTPHLASASPGTLRVPIWEAPCPPQAVGYGVDQCKLCFQLSIAGKVVLNICQEFSGVLASINGVVGRPKNSKSNLFIRWHIRPFRGSRQALQHTCEIIERLLQVFPAVFGFVELIHVVLSMLVYMADKFVPVFLHAGDTFLYFILPPTKLSLRCRALFIFFQVFANPVERR